jgi:hypothetical protein
MTRFNVSIDRLLKGAVFQAHAVELLKKDVAETEAVQCQQKELRRASC